MIRGTVYLTTNEAEKYKEYCKAHKIEMMHTYDTAYVFLMKSKKLDKFMRFAKECSSSEVRNIGLAD